MTLNKQHQVQENYQQNSHHIPNSNAGNPPSLLENGFRQPKITEIRKFPHPSPGVQLTAGSRQIRTTPSWLD